jgi:GH35 family endo-1,4-beta-xylanase
MAVRALVIAVLGAFLLWAALGRFPDGRESRNALSEAAIQERIRRYRTALASVAVLGADGKPLAGVPVVIRQTRHQFLFGSNLSGLDLDDSGPEQRAYQQQFAALFNCATLRFYWSEYEHAQDHPETERLRRVARWCALHQITRKGHPLCWQEAWPRWLAGKSTAELFDLQLRRIQREVATFAGLIDLWDVVNEAVVMPTYPGDSPFPELCRQVGTLPLLHQAFASARQANPQAILALNDYDTTVNYKKLIGACLADKVPIDVIGIQAHMHQRYWGKRHVWQICQDFAGLERPLHISEITILAGPRQEKLDYQKTYTDWAGTPEGEKQQAEHVKELYKVLFSHPKVEAITWWDFSDQKAWMGAPAGLLRKDMTPRPAYEVLQRLIKQEWWTGEVRATTDANGRVGFRGFLGSYVVETPVGQGGFRLDHAGAMEVTTQIGADNLKPPSRAHSAAE